MVKVAIVGGSLAGNKGAASMVQAVIDGARDRWPGADIRILTPLPSEDRRFVEDATDLELVPFGPAAILTGSFAALAHRSSHGRVGSAHPAVRALRDSDVVADVSGISFVDGRGLVTLAYNVLLMIVPLLLGRPVVKVAQAMGPFRGPLNRLAAASVLPRLQGVAARGATTSGHLATIGLENFRLAHDVAFLMQVTAADQRWADEIVGDRSVAVVSPSMVVAGQREAEGYTEIITSVVDRLATRSDVLLVPHAARPGQEAGRLNDLPLCERIATRAAAAERCRIVGHEATPSELRALIGRADVLVTSRFHAMISGLAVATPVLVVGWSHKYREVLEDFGLSGWTIDFRQASADRVLGDLERLLEVAPEIRARIRQELPRVRSLSAVNFELIERALEGETA